MKENIKTKKNITKIIADDDKGKVAYQEADLDTPIYYNDRINVLDDLNKGLDQAKLNTWPELKKHMLKRYSGNDLFFVSHKEDEIIGKPQLIEKHQKKIVLVRKLKKRVPGDLDLNYKIAYKFPDDNLNRRDDGFEIDNYSHWFWIYKIIDDNKEYILFSEKKLSPDLYRFRGMKIVLKDNSEISKTLRFKSLTSLFIAIEEEKAIKILSKEKLIEKFQELKTKYNLNEERFRENLFTNEDNKVYNHTENYSKVITSWLFSGKFEGYPINLLILGPVGTGKTTLLECLNNKFQEDTGIFEAGNSTLKGIIPSFKETPANPGYILDCIRMGLIDELMKMVRNARSQSKYQDHMSNYLNSLNMLLEQKDRTIGSGCDTIRAKSTAKLLFMTNPFGDYNSISNHIGLIDKTTLSRFICLVEDLDERKVIEEKNIPENVNEKMSNNEFLTIFDSCQAFLIDYDEAKIKEIYLKTLEKIGNEMKSVWSARGLHHAVLLLDGLVKCRCLFESDTTFKPKTQDYDDLEKLILYIIASWDCDLLENKRLFNL